jgi:hypothetical protein
MKTPAPHDAVRLLPGDEEAYVRDLQALWCAAVIMCYNLL